MNAENNVKVRIIDGRTDYIVRAFSTTIPTEMLKMYHYILENEDVITLHIPQSEIDEFGDSPYNNQDCLINDIEVSVGGDGNLSCINLYVRKI